MDLIVADESIFLGESPSLLVGSSTLIFLSDRIRELNEFRRTHSDLSVIEPADFLPRVAERWRDRYVEAVNSFLGKEFFDFGNYGDFWFYGHAHEKNTLGRPAFHLFCQFQFVVEKARELRVLRIHLCVRHDRGRDVLAKSLKGAGFEVILLGDGVDRVCTEGFVFFASALRLLKSFLQVSYEKGLAFWHLGRRDRLPSREIFVVYYPFLDRARLEQGVLRSNYFGDHQDEIEKDTTFIGIFVKGTGMSISEFYRGLAHTKNSARHLTYIELVSLLDLLLAFSLSVRTFFRAWFLKQKIQSASFELFALGDLIASDQIESGIDGTLIQAFLVSRAIMSGSECTRIRYLFENFGWERALCRAAHSRGWRVEAYQHCVFGLNYLHFSKDARMPEEYMPDQIGAIGPFFVERLQKMGWEPSRITSTIPYRYHYLKSIAQVSDGKPVQRGVLILFSIDEAESSSLFEILAGAFETQEDYPIYFRNHPALPQRRFMEKVPAHWVNVTAEPLTRALSRVGVTIGCQGGVLVEALLMGQELWQVRSNRWVDLAALEPGTFSGVRLFSEAIVSDRKKLGLGRSFQNSTCHYKDLFFDKNADLTASRMI